MKSEQNRSVFVVRDTSSRGSPEDIDLAGISRRLDAASSFDDPEPLKLEPDTDLAHYRKGAPLPYDVLETMLDGTVLWCSGDHFDGPCRIEKNFDGWDLLDTPIEGLEYIHEGGPFCRGTLNLFFAGFQT